MPCSSSAKVWLKRSPSLRRGTKFAASRSADAAKNGAGNSCRFDGGGRWRGARATPRKGRLNRECEITPRLRPPPPDRVDRIGASLKSAGSSLGVLGIPRSLGEIPLPCRVSTTARPPVSRNCTDASCAGQIALVSLVLAPPPLWSKLQLSMESRRIPWTTAVSSETSEMLQRHRVRAHAAGPHRPRAASASTAQPRSLPRR